MVTLYEWLKYRILDGKGGCDVILMYDNFLLGYPKKACFKEFKYECFNYLISTDLDTVEESRPYKISELFINVHIDILSKYYIIKERPMANTVHSDFAYELTVTDELSMIRKRSMKNSVYGIKPKIPAYIDPISADDCFSLRKELSRIALDGIWDSKKSLKIEKVICNGPATVIFWKDGTKTVVKCDKDDVLDYEKGILYAALKKLCNKKEYDDILRLIDAWSDFNNICTDLFPDTIEVEKPKKKVYKRKFGDSNKQFNSVNEEAQYDSESIDSCIKIIDNTDWLLTKILDVEQRGKLHSIALESTKLLRKFEGREV